MSLDLQPGAVFASDFRVVRPLSEGGMGAVYVVEQLSTGAQRALKLMKRELVADAGLRDRFLQEARVGARIASDHIVQVISAGIEPTANVPWLVMELLVGEEVDQRIKRAGPMSPAETLEMVRQLAHALAAAHAVNVVHRDLKPNNLFLAQARTAGAAFSVKILDFGIAKIIEDANASGTMAIGTPLWMAPEQTERTGHLGPGTDVWAVALIVFYVLTGRVYWLAAAAPSTSMQTLLREMLFEPIVPPSQRAHALGVGHLLPAGFDEWFLRIVERDLSRRESDIRRALATLEPLLSGAPARPIATPIGSGAPMGGAGQATPMGSAGQAAPMGSAGQATPMGGGAPAMTPAPTMGGSAFSPPGGPPALAAPEPTRRSKLGIGLGVGALFLVGGTVIAGSLIASNRSRKSKKKSGRDDDDDDDPSSRSPASRGDGDGDGDEAAAHAADCATLVAFEKQIEQTMALLDAGDPTPDQLDGYAVVIAGLANRSRGLELETTAAKSLAVRVARSLDDTAATVHELAGALRASDQPRAMAAANKVQELQKEYEAIDQAGRDVCPEL